MEPEEDNFDLLLSKISQHFHEPKARSSLQEAIARQKPEKAATAIRAIKERASEYEKWLHRDLFFAADCLAANIPGLPTVDGELGREILQELVELEAEDDLLVGEKVRDRLFNSLCSFKETDYQKQALELLKERTDLLDPWRFLEYRAALGEEEEAFALLLERLKDDDWFVKSTATELLGELGNSSPSAICALVPRLEDEYDNVRLLAAEALGKLGNSSPTVITALVARLEDEDETVRYNAAQALGKLDDNSETVIRALVARLEDKDMAVRSIASEALGNLGVREALRTQHRSPMVIEALMARLEDEESSVAWSAVEALCQLGNTSEPLIAILAARQKDCQGRSSAASSENTVCALVARLEDDNFTVRGRAAYALGELGDRSETVLDALVARLEDEHPQVRWRAGLALGNFCDRTESVVSALLALLEDESYHVRWRAALALGKLGDSSETIVSALIARLEDDKSSMRMSAAYALGQLGRKSSDVLPAVTQWLDRHQDSEYIGDGIDALWDIVAEERS